MIGESLARPRPAEEVEERLADDGFRRASPSLVEPTLAHELATFHCLLCRAPELGVRAYARLGETGEDVRVLAVCERCGSAEVVPRSRVGLAFRRTDEHSGLAAAAAVVAMAGLLGLAGVVHSQSVQLALVLLILLPVAFLAYLARKGPGNGGDPGPAA